MHLPLPKIRFLLFPVFAFITLISANPASKLFWANQIDSAIVLRDSYLKEIGVFSDGLDIDSWNKEQKTQIVSRIDMYPALNNPWYNFLKGMLHSNSSGSGREYFLNRTLFLTESDPGTTWLLFMEYTRYKQQAWADKCINQLEKLLLKSGARSSTVISQILTHYALKSEKFDKEESLKFYSLAILFNPDQAYPYLRSAWIKFPSDLPGTISELSHYVGILSQSWIVQLNFVSAFYSWFRHILIIFILAVFLIFLIKYLPSALHKQIDLYPPEISITLRTILIMAIFCSLITFGILPLLWLAAFIIWRFLSGKEKMLFSTVLVFLLLAPADCYFRNMLDHAHDPEAPLMIFSRAANEGYSQSLYKQACRNSTENPSDYLSILTASILEAKDNRISDAGRSLEKAIALEPNDPVVLITAGNLSFLNGDTEKARDYYQRIIDSEKRSYVSARFNQAQCYLKRMETITGTELINKAASMRPEYINTFIQKNDRYFSNDWPVLRKVIFPDYSAGHFWKKILPQHSGSWKSTSVLWGTTFLGIPPLISLILTFFLFAAILITQNRSFARNRIKKLFVCRFCGRVICRKCKTGLLCRSCYNESRFIRNEKSLEKTHKSIWGRFENLRSIRRDILEILFPGTGFLLEGQSSYSIVIPLIFLTSVVYSTYVDDIFSNIQLSAISSKRGITDPGHSFCVQYFIYHKTDSIIIARFKSSVQRSKQ